MSQVIPPSDPARGSPEPGGSPAPAGTFSVHERLVLSFAGVAGMAAVGGLAVGVSLGRMPPLLILGVAVAAGIVGFVVGIIATRPLAHFVQAARWLSSGRLPPHLDVNRSDELGVLHRAIQAMAVSLSSRQEMERRQAVAQTAASVAHDINNLLTVILGNAETVADELPADHPLRTEVDAIRAGARRTAHVSRRFLSLVRSRPDQRKPIDLGTLVHEVVHISRMAMPPGLRSQADVPPEPLVAEVSESLVTSALLNLILNSRDAIEGKGRVTVQLRKVHLHNTPPHGRGAALTPGTYAEINVIDTGAGIDAATMDRIFEPFFTTKAPGKGTGLGLSAVLETAVLHAGAVGVQSRRGEGTTMSLWLPVAAVVPAPPPPEDVHLPTGLRVLVVDDEPFVREVVSRMLMLSGARVTTAGGIVEADNALLGPEEFDAVVMDVVMPGGSGFGCVERLRGRGSRMAVVMHSGFFTEADEERARGLESIALRKPSNRDEIVRSLSDARKLVAALAK